MGKATIPVPVRERIVQLYEQGRSTREIAACLGFCVAAGPSARLVFVDESGANTKMTRLYGRAPVGQRRLARPPHGPYQTRTRIAGVRLRGPCAPRVFEGAMDGADVSGLGAAGLGAGPATRRGGPPGPPGHAPGARGARSHCGGGGRRLYLPPYSPDFHPIENLWSKIQQILRGLSPRTGDELLHAVASACAAISTADCHGFLLHAPYAT